jgi:hypothetical protein
MDEERKIQLLYPPLFFVVAFMAALLTDPCHGPDIRKLFEKDIDFETVAGLIAAGSVVVLVFGFVIGTVTITILRFLGCVLLDGSYEARLPKYAHDNIYQALGLAEKLPHECCRKKYRLYSAATYDHECTSESVHRWVLRRWSSFNICVSSITALVLAIAFVGLFSLRPRYEWFVIVLPIIPILFIQAVCAWIDTMLMLEFQALRKLPPRRDSSELKPESVEVSTN